jgi:glucoamylase
LRFNNKVQTMPAGARLRVEVLAPGSVEWTADSWGSHAGERTRDTGLGVYVADIPTSALSSGAAVEFTFRWDAGNWEGVNFRVAVVETAKTAATG